MVPSGVGGAGKAELCDGVGSICADSKRAVGGWFRRRHGRCKAKNRCNTSSLGLIEGCGRVGAKSIDGDNMTGTDDCTLRGVNGCRASAAFCCDKEVPTSSFGFESGDSDVGEELEAPAFAPAEGLELAADGVITFGDFEELKYRPPRDLEEKNEYERLEAAMGCTKRPRRDIDDRDAKTGRSRLLAS